MPFKKSLDVSYVYLVMPGLTGHDYPVNPEFLTLFSLSLLSEIRVT